ncbi:hypothetical protein TDB9533_02924 [Thalassocella blandensis]|nr:hypothetical protein TDB9533_02924 [Thalassocella blandensis]
MHLLNRAYHCVTLSTTLRLAVMSMFCLLAGCSKPLPQDRLSYAGHWQSTNVTLIIHHDGTVNYERKSDGVTTTINAPIKTFNGNNFVVGIAFFTTEFTVTEPPMEENGQWYMTVDGVRLSRR